jgi:hypothetical protein
VLVAAAIGVSFSHELPRTAHSNRGQSAFRR